MTLKTAKPGGFDLLAVDAFSSDSIPLHLVTREAFRIYGRALQPDGVLMIHITNRFLDLEPMIAAIGAAEGWTVRARFYDPKATTSHAQLYTQSRWVAMTRTPQAMAAFQADMPAGAWAEPRVRPDPTAWTDDFASILPVLKLPK